jgi:hypothetical protein
MANIESIIMDDFWKFFGVGKVILPTFELFDKMVYFTRYKTMNSFCFDKAGLVPEDIFL